MEDLVVIRDEKAAIFWLFDSIWFIVFFFNYKNNVFSVKLKSNYVI